jgi:uncharacterized protein YjiS (DUF1127 family)
MATATSHTHSHTTLQMPGLLPRIVEAAGDTFRLWRRRARERAELARWEDRDLRDAGISRAAIQVELAKPFWRG